MEIYMGLLCPTSSFCLSHLSHLPAPKIFKHSPTNLMKGNLIKTSFHFLHQLTHIGSSITLVKSKLGSSPILLNKVELTVIFGVEITNMVVSLNKFLDSRLLRTKDRQIKEK